MAVLDLPAHEYHHSYNEIGSRARASTRYYMILNRLNHPENPRNKTYIGKKMLIPKEEFIQWFMAHDFEGCSVDRIDNNGDYTMDNIQLIPMAENNRKDRIKAKDGKCVCWKCKQEKDLSMFVTDRSRINGHSTLCKDCDNERRQLRRMREKERKT